LDPGSIPGASTIKTVGSWQGAVGSQQPTNPQITQISQIKKKPVGHKKHKKLKKKNL